MSYERELEVALNTAREAGKVLLRHYEGQPEHWEKSEDNPVTAADLESDALIARMIGDAFPNDAMLSEETVSEPSRVSHRRVWIIDPMDGTKEFVGKIPEFAVSIALADQGDPVVGVIYNPVQDVAIWASLGQGTWRDGSRVAVSSCERLDESVVIASRTEISRGKFEPYGGWFSELRPVGSIAWKLACVASGEGDLNVSVVPKNEWDVCAGDVLVREAGGVYMAFDGSRRLYNQADPLIDRGMAAGPVSLVEEFCKRHNERS